MRAMYLHGFASSSKSSKAAFFAGKLAAHGVALEAPDLNEPDFSTLTVTRMLERVADRIQSGSEPVALIGSSLGAFVAVQSALQHPARVTHLVLLAPALRFAADRMRELGVDLEQWKASGCVDVFHYGCGRMMPVHYEFYQDLRRYDSFNARLAQPVQVFQGTRDAAVEPAEVERWCRARPDVELHLLDDEHQLLRSLDVIWSQMAKFLSLHQQIP